MDDHVIDIGEYLQRRKEREEPRSTFAVWGAEGERSRFALPLWRAAYLAHGARAAVAWERVGEVDALRPLVVLDLASEPARTELDPAMVTGIRGVEEPPALEAVGAEGLVLFLGEREGRRWYLIVTDLEEPVGNLPARSRDDIYFLAGECAGLLFHRELHKGLD